MGTAPSRSVAQQLLKLYGLSRAPVVPPLWKQPKFRILPATLFSTLDQPFSHDRLANCSSYLTFPGHCIRHVSQLASAPHASKRVIFVDTLALVRKLESQGFTAKQAEAITAAMTDVLNDSLENVADSFVSKTELQRADLMQEAALSKLEADVRTSQENKISSIQRETEKLRIDIDKLRSEMRYEMDKVTAGQRLDLNLERGRIREELANQSAETSNLTNKLDKEINALKTQLEASKYEVIKYCIGTIVSVFALGLALLRIFK